MPLTLVQGRTDVRSLIDEPVAQFWADSEINQWLNYGCEEIQRIAEWKRATQAITTTVAQQAYLLAGGTLRVYRVEFVPNNNTSYTYSLEFRGYNEMDAVWGNLKTLPSAYPEQYTLWQYPNEAPSGAAGLQILLYPVPSVAGTLNVYYYETITLAVADTDKLDIPPQWNDVIENYAAYRALQKDADPRFKDFQAIYQAQLQNLIDVTRQYTDQANWVSTGQQNYNPLFLDLEE